MLTLLFTTTKATFKSTTNNKNNSFWFTNLSHVKSLTHKKALKLIICCGVEMNATT